MTFGLSNILRLVGVGVVGFILLTGCADRNLTETAEVVTSPQVVESNTEAPTARPSNNDLGTVDIGDALEPEAVESAMASAVGIENASVQSAPERLDNVVIKTYFGTDRTFTEGLPARESFGTNRGPVLYGTADVSIPRDHRMGELEAPNWFERMLFGENLDKHVVLTGTALKTRRQFLDLIHEAAQENGANSAFVFIHGYNVSFEKAARRTAQMAYDLGFDGAPIFYSWPSQGSLTGYSADEETTILSQPDVKAFLEDIGDRLAGQNIHLIAHSMGNRPVTGALKELYREQPDFRGRFREIILAAPDINREIFVRDLAPYIVTPDQPVTLYTSSRDAALLASKKVHSFARIGDARDGVTPLPGFEIVDASNVNTSLLNHSYFADATSVLSDIFKLLKNGERASQRSGLTGIDHADGVFWEINMP